ncbi:hypothetical protein JXB41_01455 [Candidatus Woesearchaeota archaeon]|nr:hypothetical protein [Candidatus Woesearchaeota archaeon]
MDFKILETIGLTKNETKVYITLSEKGSALAGQITEKTGIHRRNVYDALERLIEKGLVSYINIDNRRWFNPANPNRFLELIDEKKSELDKNKKIIKDILPYFLQLRKEMPKQDVRFFKGTQGLKSVFEDILRTNENYLGYGPGAVVEKILNFYFPYYIKKRIRSKIHYKLIYEESVRNKKYTENPLSEIKFLPDEYISHTAQRIYGDKVAILLISEEDPLAIIIKNMAITDSFRKHFEILWKSAKK